MRAGRGTVDKQRKGRRVQFPSGSRFLKKILPDQTEFANKSLPGNRRFEIEDQCGLGLRAQGGTKLIDGASFQSVARNKKLAQGGFRTRVDPDIVTIQVVWPERRVAEAEGRRKGSLRAGR
jgi:hypothetical protein